MKKLLYLTCALWTAVSVSAAVRTPENAAQLAADFTNSPSAPSRMHRSARVANDMILTHTFRKPMSDQAALYVFNTGDNMGFVMVSADDRTVDIPVYSDEGSFNLETANPNFLWWVEQLQNEIASLPAEDDEPSVAITEATQITAVQPLLGNIAWDQEEPYWNQCPMDLWKTSERCLTGCVATATAQIMKYHEWPAQGIGSHSYTWNCCMNSSCTRTRAQTLSKDFSTITFDWNNMLDTYGTSTSSYTTAQANAVSTLMAALGIACDMEYGGSTIGGSGSWTDNMGYGMEQFFSYKPGTFITTYTKADYESENGKGEACKMPNSRCRWGMTKTAIRDSIIAEVQAGRPVLMGGEGDENSGAHEFVCDGCDANSRLHINWGWSGDCNCYTTITTLKPTGTSYSFASQIDALIHIVPNRSATDIKQVREEKEVHAEKFIRNGHLYIRHGDRVYGVMGE